MAGRRERALLVGGRRRRGDDVGDDTFQRVEMGAQRWPPIGLVDRSHRRPLSEERRRAAVQFARPGDGVVGSAAQHVRTS